MNEQTLYASAGVKKMDIADGSIVARDETMEEDTDNEESEFFDSGRENTVELEFFHFNSFLHLLQRHKVLIHVLVNVSSSQPQWNLVTCLE